MELPVNLSRSLTTIVVPGIVATAPALLLLLSYYPQLGSLYKEYTWPVNICCFALVVVIGSLIDTGMTYLEKHWDGEIKESDYTDETEDWANKNWYEYLARRFGDHEPVGYRYISKTFTSMCFELLSISVPIALVSLGFLLIHLNARLAAGFLFAAAPISYILLLRSAKDTHGLLCRVRYQLNQRLG